MCTLNNIKNSSGSMSDQIFQYGNSRCWYWKTLPGKITPNLIIMKNGENWKILESLYSFRNMTETVVPVHQQSRCYLVPGHPISLQKPWKVFKLRQKKICSLHMLEWDHFLYLISVMQRTYFSKSISRNSKSLKYIECINITFQFSPYKDTVTSSVTV